VPELPEVETVVRELRPLVIGQRITGVTVSARALRRAWSPGWARELVGRRVLGISRRGKWIFVETGKGRILVIHLGMTGQLTVVASGMPVEPHTHVVFALGGTKRELRFRDIRRFGSVVLLPAGRTVEMHLASMGLGPEPFEATLDYWRERLGRTQRNLKAVLLDQRVVAGVGNIYADESLFAARLHPARLGSSLSSREVRRLGASVPQVLERAIAKRGSSIRDYVGGSGLRGGFQDEFCVYGRTGKDCHRCGRPIQQIRLAGRATHFCPRCQKA
jgi:formamidopyrimidine-DNA glycosylase